MTESFDRPSGANNATGLSIEGGRVLQALAGATGAKTATAAGNADAGNAHILALRPAGANLAISKPAGTVTGDVMVAAIAFNNSGAAVTAPSGWTLVRRTNNTSTTSNALAVYRRSAIAGEPASYTWGIAGGAFAVGGIQSFSGADAANPIDVENGQSTASATAHDTPSITTSVANTMLVTAHTYASSNTWTPQAGLTEGFDRPSGTNSTTGQSVTGGYQLMAASGASGAKRSTAGGGADVGNTHILALRPFVPNAPPTVSLTSPANGSTFTAPASITLTATAADSDGTIQKVEFFHGGSNLIATVTTAPYTLSWTGVPQGSYVLTAVATDNQTATTSSAPVNVTVQVAVAQLYFVEVDHLNTPRLVANQSGQTVWRWDQQEPFGINVPDENPSGLGTFEFPIRFPGQYFDSETNVAYNFHRDYDPGTGRYIQSDPIGLQGGPNTYLYVEGNPLDGVDPSGLFKCIYDPANVNMLNCTLVDKSATDRDVYQWRPTGEGVWYTLRLSKPQFGVGPTSPKRGLPITQPPVGPNAPVQQYWEIQFGYSEETRFRQNILSVVEEWECPDQGMCKPNRNRVRRNVTCYSDWVATSTTRKSPWTRSYLKQVQ